MACVASNLAICNWGAAPLASLRRARFTRAVVLLEDVLGVAAEAANVATFGVFHVRSAGAGLSLRITIFSSLVSLEVGGESVFRPLRRGGDGWTRHGVPLVRGLGGLGSILVRLLVTCGFVHFARNLLGWRLLRQAGWTDGPILYAEVIAGVFFLL